MAQPCKFNPPVKLGWKITWIFEQTNVQGMGSSISAGRQSGWSESWYFPSSIDFNSVIVAQALMANARCGLLNAQAKIVEVRVHNLATNQTVTRPSNRIGLGPQCDIPQQALLARAGSTIAFNTRAVELRGLPDDWVQGGELSPGIVTGPLKAYSDALVANGAMFPGLNKNLPRFGVIGVSADTVAQTAIVSCNESIVGIAPGMWIRFYRTTQIASCCGSVCDAKVNVVGDTTMTLTQYTSGSARGGKVGQRPALGLLPVGGYALTAERCVIRKVGRPFDGFSGRKSKTCCRC